MFDIKNTIKSEKLFNENLYYPLGDNKTEKWVNEKLRLEKNTASVMLSCPYCFIQVCYDAQRHEKYENQYRTLHVYNCKIDCTRSLKFGTEAKPPSHNTQTSNITTTKSNNDSQRMDIVNTNDKNKEDEDVNYELEYEDTHEKEFEYFFPVHCKECSTELGVYDVEGKIYHLFNILPSLGSQL